MNLKELGTTDFWFTESFLAFNWFDKGIVVLVFIMVLAALAGLILFYSSKSEWFKTLIAKWVAPNFWTAILLALWLGCRYERAQVLSLRIIPAALILLWLGWLIPAIRYWRGEYQLRTKAAINSAEKNKYIQMKAR